MNAAQYKNIIKWTIATTSNVSNIDSLSFAKKVFDNLGVAFPHGDLNEITNILNNSKYLGWRNCSQDQAQKYANIGIPTIGLDSSKIIIIIPDNEIDDLCGFEDVSHITHENAKRIDEIIDDEDCENLKYYTYSYGYKI